MRVGVFADVHANADALEAVLRAAADAAVDELWSLGDMVGSGPDAARAVALVRATCTVALIGNHDREPAAVAPLQGTADLEWVRARKPAARRAGVRCWHGSPRHPVHEYVTAANAGECLARQRAAVGLVGHTHEAAAWRAVAGGGAERVAVAVGEPRALRDGKWMLNPGAVGVPFPVRGGWARAMGAHARAGASWLELDLDALLATWHRAPFDPRPVIERARAAGSPDRAAALR